MPRTKPSPPTIVLFVRHGETPTTGKVLPGQAPGLHLSDRGRAQVEGRPPRPSPASARWPPSTRRRWSGPGRRPPPIAEAIGVEPVERCRAARPRHRRVDRPGAQGPVQAARVAHGPAPALAVPLPGRRVGRRGHGARARHGRTASWPSTRASRRGRVALRRHSHRARQRAGLAGRPVGPHRGRHGVDQRRGLRARWLAGALHELQRQRPARPQARPGPSPVDAGAPGAR